MEEQGIEKNYLEEITKLKEQMATMVPGEDYNKVLDEHRRLTSEFINQRPHKQVDDEELNLHKELHDITLAIPELASSKKDLDLAEALLRQRDLSIDLLGVDTMVGHSFEGNGVIRAEDASEIADSLKEAVAYGRKNSVTLVQAVAATKAFRKP